jgi:hypothetical protein
MDHHRVPLQDDDYPLEYHEDGYPNYRRVAIGGKLLLRRRHDGCAHQRPGAPDCPLMEVNFQTPGLTIAGWRPRRWLAKHRSSKAARQLAYGDLPGLTKSPTAQCWDWLHRDLFAEPQSQCPLLTLSGGANRADECPL